MLSVVILVGAVGGGFVLSYCFLTWILFANFEIKNARWLGLFSGTFAVSVGLFTFYSLDILQVDSATYVSTAIVLATAASSATSCLSSTSSS
jgi:hypothetical protein